LEEGGIEGLKEYLNPPAEVIEETVIQINGEEFTLQSDGKVYEMNGNFITDGGQAGL